MGIGGAVASASAGAAELANAEWVMMAKSLIDGT